ncbi:MAG: hypothetical protein ACYC5M_14040 [Anaerolineae bacterium]
MTDGTRLIFWIDLAILLVVCLLVLTGQWDWVLALFIGLLVLNVFDRLRVRRRPQ